MKRINVESDHQNNRISKKSDVGQQLFKIVLFQIQTVISFKIGHRKNNFASSVVISVWVIYLKNLFGHTTSILSVNPIIFKALIFMAWSLSHWSTLNQISIITVSNFTMTTWQGRACTVFKKNGAITYAYIIYMCISFYTIFFLLNLSLFRR